MSSENVAVGAAVGGGDVGWPTRTVYGTMWLFHTGTGDLRRVYAKCGDEYPDGCHLDAPALEYTDSVSSYGAFRPTDRGWTGP